MRLVAAVAIGTAIFCQNPAWADWQYTKWGMTPAQVAAASHGTVSVSSGDAGDRYSGADIGAVGTYSSGEYHFKSVFYFVSNKLVDVRLSFQGDGYKLKNALDGLYGKPFYESNDSIAPLVTYHDPGKNNRIDLLMIGSSNTLEYRPLKDASASGL